MYDMDKQYLIIDLSKLRNGTLIMIGEDCGINGEYFKQVEYNGMIIDTIDEEAYDAYCDKVVDALYLDKEQFVDDYLKEYLGE